MSNYSTTHLKIMDLTLTTQKLIKVNNKGIKQAWLVTNNGGILIKNIEQLSKNVLSIKDITLEVNSMSSLIKEIEKVWGIICNTTDLSNIYSYMDNSGISSKQINGYLLFLNLDKNHIKTILEKDNSIFIDYRNLEETLSTFNFNIDFKESFYSLLLELDKRFGTKVTVK